MVFCCAIAAGALYSLAVCFIAFACQRKSYFCITLGTEEIGPLQLAIHVVQTCSAGKQKLHWDKTNKENYHLKLCMSFVCLVPLRLLLSSMAVCTT